MNTEQIIELARECGAVPMRDNDSMGAGFEFELDALVKFATLVTQAEREECNRKTNAAWKLMCEKMAAAERTSRQAAQAENEQLKARLARSGVELRSAVLAEREKSKRRII